MRIRDIVQSFRNTVRKVFFLRRFNPFDKQGRRALINQLKNRGIRAVEKVEIDLDSEKKSREQKEEKRKLEEFLTEVKLEISPYPEYPCLENNPLICSHSQKYLDKFRDGKYCPKCAFPFPLKSYQEIQGRKGLYQITNLIGYRAQGRLYQCLKNDQYIVIIKEYLFPKKYFPNSADIQPRQETFVRVGNPKLADGILRDFRLILPQEAISDEAKERCYLITNELGKLPTLKSYLKTNNLMKEEQIIRLLDQVLQSLEFLHGQKFLFANGIVEKGIIHGNINSDSLLIKDNKNNFFVYLSDFFLWENLFNPSFLATNQLEVQDDLVKLGYVCLYALLGKKINHPSQMPSPQREPKWQQIDLNVRTFIGKLISSQFKSATEARRSLKNLSLTQAKKLDHKTKIKPEEKSRKKNLWWLLALALLLGLGGIVWRLLTRPSVKTVQKQPIVKYIANIINVPEGEYKFAITDKKFDYQFNRFVEAFVAGNRYYKYAVGTANYVFLGEGIIEEDQQFIGHIQAEIKQENFATTFAPIFVNDNEEAAQKIIDFQADFAIISDLKNQAECDEKSINNNQLKICPIVYDALVVFVPFSTYEKSLHEALEGQISFEQLRDIYLGRITKWNQLSENAPNIDIKPFIPEDPVAVEFFEQQILENNPRYLEQFRARIGRGFSNNNIEQKDTITKDQNQCNTINLMKKSFNNAVGFADENENNSSDSTPCETREKYGGISFGILSKTFQNFPQCEIYPLALKTTENSAPIQLVKTKNNSALKDALDDCNKEQLYLDENLFWSQQQEETYPLIFTLAVMYPDLKKREDVFNNHYQMGEKFVKILKTEEAQCWLREAQLIPLQPLKNCENLL